ncbi:hypothetical protein [Cellulosilyticum ruminicola]|uniref:hypothetical protein n=1 Tax=Cellulosilyticum ruminicola TaxID=425254 RepID=UPI0006D1A2AA|nr:hypothetical protein [Cellulosilyticum ruminicola]
MNKVLLTINGIVYTGTQDNPVLTNGVRVVVYDHDGNPIANDITATAEETFTNTDVISLLFLLQPTNNPLAIRLH